MATYSDTEYELDIYGWDAPNQERYFIKTITTFSDLEIIDYVDDIDTGTFSTASSGWPSDAQSVRVIEKQSGTDVYRGKVVEETVFGSSIEVETEGTYTGAAGVVGDVEYSIYIGATSEASPDFQEKITNFRDLSANLNSGSMSDWSAQVPPQPRLEEYGFERVTIWNEENDTAFFVGVLETVETDPKSSTSISGRGVLVEEDYKSASVTYSNIAVTDAIQDFTTNYMEFDWSFVGDPAQVDATIGTNGKTFTGTHYEIFRDLHNLASIDFNLVYNDWNDVDLQSFRIGNTASSKDVTIKDYTRGFDYTDYANKITLVGAGGVTATAEDTTEINNFGKTVHKTVRKPRLTTQTEVDNAVQEVLNKAISQREQSGSVEVVPTNIDVGFDYNFDVFQNYFLDGKHVTNLFAEFPDKDSHLQPNAAMIPTDGNDSMVELLVYPEIKNLGPDEYQYLISGYDAPDFLKLYGDGSLGVQTNAMDTEERTPAGLLEHQSTARISVLIWNDIFAGSGNVHYGRVWIDGGNENQGVLSFDGGDEIFLDKQGGGVNRVSTEPLRIGTNHPIKRFDETHLENHYPIEGMSATTDPLVDDANDDTTGRFSGSVSSLVSGTPKGQAVSLEAAGDGYSADSGDSFQTLGPDGFTFLAYVNVDSLGTGTSGADDEFRTLYGNGVTPEDGVTSDYGHSFVLSDNGVEVHWQASQHTNSEQFTSVFNPEPGKWEQIGVQFYYDDATPSNSEIRIIYNGEIVETTPWTEPSGDYSNVNTMSLFNADGIQTTNGYQFLGDVAEVRLMDGDVDEATFEEIYKYTQHKYGFTGGIDDVRFWSDNESYTDFTDISNGYHLVPEEELTNPPQVSATGETPLQTILNIPYREVDTSWDGSVLINEVLRGYVTFESIVEPDLDFTQDEGPAVTFNNFNVTVPTENARVEEAQFNLSMDGGNLSLNLDISNRIDTILSESRQEIEDTKQVL